MKILIAVDGSAYTTRVLDFVAAHRELLGATGSATLLTSVPAIPPHATHFVDHEVLRSYYDEEAEAVLGPAREAMALAGLAAGSVACRGPAPVAIADYATSGGFDLVVMGSHGRSALSNVVLGSVVTGVLAHCRIPVLIVR